MAKQETSSQEINSATGAVLALLGLATVGSLDLGKCGLIYLLGIPVKVAIEALPSILLAAWHLLQPCALVHLRFLDGLLRISVSWLPCVLALAGVA
ncbi:MAG: hypothetical protein DMG38_16210 [Acidobacteria bacterium]|nr:MAG: hypothetical protein DMG38_16210 [Acidobacteriota bacterium]